MRTSFKKTIGNRTLGANLAVINRVAKNAVQRSVNLFLSVKETNDNQPDFVPDENKLRSTLDLYRRRHAAMFRKLSAAGVYAVSADVSLHEIGYISGGYSILAFEQRGFEANGIDNYYAGLEKRVCFTGTSRSLHVRKRTMCMRLSCHPKVLMSYIR